VPNQWEGSQRVRREIGWEKNSISRGKGVSKGSAPIRTDLTLQKIIPESPAGETTREYGGLAPDIGVKTSEHEEKRRKKHLKRPRHAPDIAIMAKTG